MGNVGHPPGENSSGVYVVAPSAFTPSEEKKTCTAGQTLTDTWTLFPSNPALLQVTATTSMTTTSFYATYTWNNRGQSSVTQ